MSQQSMSKDKQIREILCYFSNLKDNDVPDRQFMWNKINTWSPFSTEELISKAQKNRISENKDNIDDQIEIKSNVIMQRIKIKETISSARKPLDPH